MGGGCTYKCVSTGRWITLKTHSSKVLQPVIDLATGTRFPITTSSLYTPASRLFPLTFSPSLSLSLVSSLWSQQSTAHQCGHHVCQIQRKRFPNFLSPALFSNPLDSFEFSTAHLLFLKFFSLIFFFCSYFTIRWFLSVDSIIDWFALANELQDHPPHSVTGRIKK